MAKKKLKKKQTLQGGYPNYTMRVVTSDKCVVCPTPCTRGMLYVQRMKQPGAVGNGVPCILTRTRLGS